MRMTTGLRWALYTFAAVVGVSGAAFGFSKAVTLLLIALIVVPIELMAQHRQK